MQGIVIFPLYFYENSFFVIKNEKSPRQFPAQKGQAFPPKKCFIADTVFTAGFLFLRGLGHSLLKFPHSQ